MRWRRCSTYVGYDVTREYYINDAGGQIDVLAQSAFLRYREALGETIEIPPGLYPGDYLMPVGERLAATFGRDLLDMPEAEWLPKVKELTLEMMLELIRSDLAELGVTHDVFFSERTLHGQGGDIDLTLDWLREQGLVYQGRLDQPKGAGRRGLGRPRADAVPGRRCMATTSIGRWSSRTAATPISPPTSPITATSICAASGT